MPEALSVSAHLDATPAHVWALLTDPTRHHEFDNSGMVGAPETPEPLLRVGQVFRMNMSFVTADGGRRDYQSDNHVSALEPARLIGWRTAGRDKPPYGWEWRYDLRPADDGGTDVTLTWDYTDCTPEIRERFNIPAFWSAAAFEGSLALLDHVAATS